MQTPNRGRDNIISPLVSLPSSPRTPSREDAHSRSPSPVQPRTPPRPLFPIIPVDQSVEPKTPPRPKAPITPYPPSIRRFYSSTDLKKYHRERSVSPSEQWNHRRRLRKVYQGERPETIPIPFQHPTTKDIRNLYDVVRCSLPPLPPPVRIEKATTRNTKGLSQAELRMNIDGVKHPDILEEIVFAPQMLDKIKLEARNQLSEFAVNFNDPAHLDLVSAVVPWITTAVLPLKINSEKDTEDWGMYAGVAPLMLIIDALLGKKIRSRRDPLTGALRGDIPYVCSSTNLDGVVPDCIMIGPDGKTDATGEFKLPSVLVLTARAHQDAAMFPAIQSYHFLNKQIRKGCAIKFLWPEATEVQKKGVRRLESVKKASSIKKHTRIIIQKWSQMVAASVKHGMLSTYDATTFLYRENKRLYMSRTYVHTDADIQIATLAWLMLSLGVVKPEDGFLYLPTVTSDWYKADPKIVERIRQVEGEGTPGIMLPTAPVGGRAPPIKANRPNFQPESDDEYESDAESECED